MLDELKFIRDYSRNFDYKKEDERISQNPLIMWRSKPEEWHKAFLFRRFRDGLNHKMVFKYSCKLLRDLKKL